MSFDDAFAAYAASPRLRELFSSAFDARLPPEVEPFSFVPLDGLRLIASRLALAEGDLLLDMACGRGGPGMWVARETGASLIGIDPSKVAVSHAGQRRASFGLEERADFRLGEFGALDLADESVDGVMCVDALQFAPDLPAALADLHRCLRPRRRLVTTIWDGPRRDGHFPIALGDQLTAAGFTDVEVTEHPEWEERRRAVYESALGLDPGDDQGLANLRAEAELALPAMPATRRLLISGAKPLSR